MNDLRKLAEEATPGPWYAGLGTVLTPTDEPGRNRVIVHTGITTPRGGRHRGGEDATYIAAASPDVILGLLDRIAELEETAGGLCDLIVSYADLTHRVFVEGGDWRDIANEWATVVAAARERRLEPAARSSSKVETGVEK